MTHFLYQYTTAHVKSRTMLFNSSFGHTAVPLELRNSSEVHVLLNLPAYDCPQTTYAVPHKPWARTYRKHVTWSLSTVVWRHCIGGRVFTEPLLRNGLHNRVIPWLLRADDIKNTASSIVACWTMFTELLPGNALIKSDAGSCFRFE
jgi:hypothetical protein